jgi:hypothetical protein
MVRVPLNSLRNGLAQELLQNVMKFHSDFLVKLSVLKGGVSGARSGESQLARAIAMKKRFKQIELFLVVAISAFIFAFPAYLHCTDLSGDRIFSTDLSFENSDQVDGSPNEWNQLKASVSVILPNRSLQDINLFPQLSHLFFRTLSNRQEIFVLLC